MLPAAAPERRESMKTAIFAAGGGIDRCIAQDTLNTRSRAVGRDPEGFERIDSAVRVTKAAATGSAGIATAARGADACVSAVDPNKSGQSDDVLAQAAHGLVGGAHRAGVRRLLVLCDAAF